ncbi:MAG: ArnT family glycosyltransferase, partial [bacterium]
GLSIISYLTLSLALIGALYKWSCLILLSLLTPIAIWGLYNEKNIIFSVYEKIRLLFPLKRQHIFEYFILSALFISIILCLIISLAPPTDFDSLVYHLSIPKIWIQNHKAIYIPYISQSVYHLTIETLFALGMLLSSDISANLIIWSYSILFVLALISLSIRYFSIKIGLLASLAAYITPLFGFIANKPMVDLPSTFYALLSVYAFLMYMDSDKRSLLAISAITASLGAACKHSGLVPFAVLFFWVVLTEIKRRKISFISFSNVALFFLIFVLILSPWFVRSYIYTGKIISTRIADTGYFVNLIGGKTSHPHNFIDHIRSWSENHSFHDLMKFLFIETLIQGSPYSLKRWCIGAFVLAFVPCLALARKSPDKRIKYLLAYSIAGLVLHYCIDKPTIIGVSDARTAAPVYTGLFISGAYAVYWLLNNFLSLKRYIQVVVILSSIFNIILSYYTSSIDRFSIVIGIETRDKYLERKTGGMYNIMKYANENLGDNVKILTMDPRGYHFDKPYIIMRYGKIEKVTELVEKLKADGITHVFFNNNASNTGFFSLPDELRAYMELLQSKNNVYLYRFKWAGI